MDAEIKYHQTETQIVEEYKIILESQKDPAKFEVLYHKYYSRITAFIYRRVDDKQLAFDITSQVFLKAMINLPSYKFKGLPFSSWLYRITYNELCDFFKRKEAHQILNLETAPLKEWIAEEDDDRNDAYLEKLLYEIPLLASKERELIEMRFFDELSFKEIADILDISENGAKMRLYRVLEKIKLKILTPVKIK